MRLLVDGSVVKLKNEMKTDGMKCWCFRSQSGLITPSGKRGDPGVRGEMGEWSIQSGGDLEVGELGLVRCEDDRSDGHTRREKLLCM